MKKKELEVLEKGFDKKKWKNRKVSGMNGIPVEAQKVDSSTTVKEIKRIIAKVKETNI